MSGAGEGHRWEQRTRSGNSGHEDWHDRRSEKLLRPVDLAVNAIAQVGDLEIQRQAKHQSGESKIREQLRLMHGEHFLHTFDLEDQAIFDNEVDRECRRDLQALVGDRHLDLALKRQSDAAKLRAKRLLVGTLKKTGTERAMDVHPSPNRSVTPFVGPHSRFPLCVLGHLCVLGSATARQTERRR
jgi:hypothetical protein